MAYCNSSPNIKMEDNIYSKKMSEGADMKDAGIMSYSMGVTDKKMAAHLAGASMSDAIALDVMEKSYGIKTPNSSDMFQSTRTDDMRRHQKDSSMLDVEKLLTGQKDTDLLKKYLPREDEFDPMKVLPGREKKQQYEYQQAYDAYKTNSPEKKTAKIYQLQEQDIGTLSQKEISKEYRSTQSAQQEDYHSSLFQTQTPISDLEMINYAVAALKHSYSSQHQHGAGIQPSRQLESQHYAVANTLYHIIASEGYLAEQGLGYLHLTVDDGRDRQQYMVMVKYNDDKKRTVAEDKLIIKELEGLLNDLTGKMRIDSKDIVDTLTNIIENRLNGNNNEQNLFMQEMDVQLMIKRLQGIKIRDGDNLVVLLKKEELNLLKRLRTIVIKDPKEKLPYKNYQRVVDAAPYLYSLPVQQYLKKLEDKRKDFTNNVPAKFVTKFPKSIMGGVLGFTYLGENMMGIRDDLYGEEANEVEIHEAIHTDNEYETRLITKWMLDDDTIFH